MNAFRIEIQNFVKDSRARSFLTKIKGAGFKVNEVFTTDIYTVRKNFTAPEKSQIAEMLANPLYEKFGVEKNLAPQKFDWAIEIGFLPGVTDNVGRTVVESIEDLFKVKFARPDEDVYSSQVLYLSGSLDQNTAESIGKLFANPLIQRIHVKSHADFIRDGGMDLVIPEVKIKHTSKVDIVDLEIPDAELEELGKKGIKNADGTRRGPLALSLKYLYTIREYFRKEKRNPTDVELESIAQTWSEHCKHTIFANPIDDIQDGIFRHFIKRATKEVREKKGKKDFCVSVFSDNAGGIIFDDKWVVTDKAETHNSPAALDPFGAAITGIVGVNRDALGYGKGAKPVINRYGYCFADPEKTFELYRGKNKQNPALQPATVMSGVIAGVNEGGNQSGIPSPQGFVYFDDRFAGKPLVFVGTIGIVPRQVDGEDSAKKKARPGDRIVVAGGRVGADGIHGATFSSEALNEGSPATAVQIGDPITQKKLSDTIIREIRDGGFLDSITDNGAGGISCSVAEMAEQCGGCEVNLDRVPLKYPHLSPWEIWISESQERMTFAVKPTRVKDLIALLDRRGVEAVDIGEFTDSGRCKVLFGKEVVMDTNLDFLENGWPREKLQTVRKNSKNDEPDFACPNDLASELQKLLSRKNICSYEFISQQYDHEVLAGSTVKPLQGKGRVNGSASVTRPVLDSPHAVVASQGINSRFSDIDTYWMAASGLDDAVAAAVAVGADPDYMALMDNFCWCSSDDPERLGQLIRAAEACYDLATSYGTPFISGKDSMFNDFRGFDEKNNPIKVSVPPTVLGSALSVIPDATKVATMDFKIAEDLIYVIGDTRPELGASEYFDEHGFIGNSAPHVDFPSAIDRYRRMFAGHQKNLFASALHIDKGGLGVALAKAAIAGEMGAEVSLQNLGMARADFALFSESKSRFLVSINPAKKSEFEKAFPEAKFLGKVGGDSLKIVGTLEVPVAKLAESYKKPFKNY